VAERRAIPTNRREALGGAKDDFASIERWNPFSSTGANAELRRLLMGDPEGWRLFVRAWFRISVEIVRRNWAPLNALTNALIDAFGDDYPLEGPQLRKLLKPVRSYHLGPPRWRWPNGLVARTMELGPTSPLAPPPPVVARQAKAGVRTKPKR
jgi:hypothetical protein